MSQTPALLTNTEADVSVVMPCYCCTETIDRAITSVLSQTTLPKELILVDDASGDGTLEKLQAWRDRYPDFIRVVALSRNQGAGEARNAGWAISTGKYVAFLDADDSWHPKKLAIQYEFMQNNPDVCLSGHVHAFNVVSDQEVVENSSAQNVRWWQLLASNPFVTPSVMVRQDVDARFKKGRRYMEDHLLWMELVLTQRSVVRLDIPLAILHKAQVGVSGLSSHMWAMTQADLGNYWQLYREGLLGFFPLLLFWIWASLKFFRRIIWVGMPNALHRWRRNQRVAKP